MIPKKTNGWLIRAGTVLGAAMPLVWEKSAFGIIASLIGSGVIGLWTLSINVGRLEERVSAWTILYEKRFDGMEKKFDRYDVELIRLQGRQRQ